MKILICLSILLTIIINISIFLPYWVKCFLIGTISFYIILFSTRSNISNFISKFFLGNRNLYHWFFLFFTNKLFSGGHPIKSFSLIITSNCRYKFYHSIHSSISLCCILFSLRSRNYFTTKVSCLALHLIFVSLLEFYFALINGNLLQINL